VSDPTDSSDPSDLTNLSSTPTDPQEPSPANTAAKPWQNVQNPLDVNADGAVTPLDVLIVAMRINDQGSGVLTGTPADDGGPLHYVDTSGDGMLAPIDTLLVINYIEQHGADTAEGEAAPTTANPGSVLAQNQTEQRSQNSPLGPSDERVAVLEVNDFASASSAAAGGIAGRAAMLLAEDFSSAGIAIDEVIGDLAENLIAIQP
jgi:hypothetical protein